jgi:formylglycine-generating enzyme required for sulfatase activity
MENKEGQNKIKVIIVIAISFLILVIFFVAWNKLRIRINEVTEKELNSKDNSHTNDINELNKKLASMEDEIGKIKKELKDNSVQLSQSKNNNPKGLYQDENQVMDLMQSFKPLGLSNFYAYFSKTADSLYKMDIYADALKNYQLALVAPDKPNNIETNSKIGKVQKCIYLFDQANRLYYAKSYDKARDVYLKINDINPSSRNALMMAEYCKPIKEQNLILIEGGEYNPTGKLSIKINSFYTSAYEVSNMQFARFLNEYGAIVVKEGSYKGQKLIDINGKFYREKCRIDYKNGIFMVEKGYELNPVIYISWYGANEFCKFYGLRLPAENEWEYAAIGGKKTNHYNFSGSNVVNEVAWYSENTFEKGTKPIGLKHPNELGVFDMSGNVWEWCNDWYHDENMISKSDSVINSKNVYKVLRGGSWLDGSGDVKINFRVNDIPISTNDLNGFRFVITAK